MMHTTRTAARISKTIAAAPTPPTMTVFTHCADDSLLTGSLSITVESSNLEKKIRS